MINNPINLLTVAGSDASGAAGVQADLRTFHSLGAHGCSVISAITAQGSSSSDGRQAFFSQAVDLQIFSQQLSMLLHNFDIAAVKTGMLATPAQVQCLAETLPEDIPLIIDPVLQTSSGYSLIDDDTLTAMREWLLPRAWLVTPNLPELPQLIGSDQDDAPFADIIETILGTGCKAVLLKGGHAESQQLSDVLYQRDSNNLLQTHHYHHPRQAGEYRGTGCVLSAAIATFAAQNKSDHPDSLPTICQAAIDYLQACIRLTPTPAAGEAAILRHPLSVTDH